MFQIDDQVFAFFVQYASNVAADFTRDSIGWLSRRLNPRARPTGLSLERLNLGIQASLAGAGVSEAFAVRVTRFILEVGNLSYLSYLHATANEDSDASVRFYRQKQFRAELKAHLIFDGGIPADSSEIELCVDCIEQTLDRLTRAQASGSRIEVPGAPSSYVFGDIESRVELFEAMGQPDLAAFLAYSRRYARAARDHYGYVELQHLGSTDDVRVPLSDIYVEPVFRAIEDGKSQQPRGIPAAAAISSAPRTVFLGPAGIGKSTFMRYVAALVAESSPEGDMVPFVVELRTFVTRPEIALFVEHIREKVTTLVQAEPPPGWIQYMLLSGRAVTQFDGFDEVLEVGDRSRIRDAIRSYSRLYAASAVFVTSRVHGYSAAPFPDKEFSTFQVEDFDDPQVEDYARKWFARRGSALVGTDHGVDSFLEETARFVPELRRIPLLLSLLCGLYSSRGGIPRTLGELYERCATLLFQDWETMRRIEDSGAWAVNLRPGLYMLANAILENPDYRSDGIPQADMERLLQKYWTKTLAPDEAVAEARRVVKMWSGRQWIIAAVNTDEFNRPKFGFVHQSFLEYFVALFETRKGGSADDLYARLRPRLLSETGWLVVQLSISLYDQWYESGGDSFAKAVLADIPRLGAAERTVLVRFLAGIGQFLTLSRDTQAAIAKLVLEHVSTAIARSAGEGDLPPARQRTREDESSNDRSFESEVALEELLEWVSVDVVVEELRTQSTIPRTLAMDSLIVLSALCLAILQLSESPKRDVLASSLADIYSGVKDDLSWVGVAAGVSVGLVSIEDALAVIPIERIMTGCELVRSRRRLLVFRPVVSGNVLNDFLRPSASKSKLLPLLGPLAGVQSRPVLRANLQIQWPQVSDRSRVKFAPINSDGWGEQHFLGASALLLLCLEENGPEYLKSLDNELHSQLFRTLLRMMWSKPSQLTSLELGALPESSTSLVRRWHDGEVRFSR